MPGTPHVPKIHHHFSYVDGDGFQLLVLTTMVAAVKRGLRSKLEFARQEYISVLSQLVKAFPTHPRFSSMAPLSHHEPEADFFENVKHIQLHRRTRAFRKLAGLCAEGSLTQACIMNFILPLANRVSVDTCTCTSGVNLKDLRVQFSCDQLTYCRCA